MYLGEKSGKFYDKHERLKINQWLMIQMAIVGPFIGQHHQFHHYNPGKSKFGEERYFKITKTIYRDLDERLGQSKFLAGDKYTIADIACFPWALNPGRKCQKPSDFKNVARWLQTIEKRPAVERGMKVLANERRDMSKGLDDETRRNLFGSAQYKKY